MAGARQTITVIITFRKCDKTEWNVRPTMIDQVAKQKCTIKEKDFSVCVLTHTLDMVPFYDECGGGLVVTYYSHATRHDVTPQKLEF
jgi:hypothetical protein